MAQFISKTLIYKGHSLDETIAIIHEEIIYTSKVLQLYLWVSGAVIKKEGNCDQVIHILNIVIEYFPTSGY